MKIPAILLQTIYIRLCLTFKDDAELERGEKKFHPNFSEPLNRQGLQLSYSLKTMQIPLGAWMNLSSVLRKARRFYLSFTKWTHQRYVNNRGSMG